jgi:hypothetical protein
MSTIRNGLLPVLLALFVLALYWSGAVRQLEVVNTDLDRIDQGAYMNYAKKLHDSNYTHTGNRNRMPIYPFLQSLLYQPNMSEETFFSQGKYLNLALSIVALIGIYLVIRPSLPKLHALVFMLISAFTVFIFKAGFFQAEILFYFLSFLVFVLMMRLLERPSYPLAVVTGVLIGLAHLTKASMLPALVLFALFAVAKGLYLLRRQMQEESFASALTSLKRPLLVGPIVMFFFLVTVFPYIRTSKQIFGQYFYNVNSTFYVWYDSWDEAVQGTKAHGDRVGWPDMPPEDIPSFTKYMREHDLSQIAFRFWSGSTRLVEVMSTSYGYFKYILLYLAVLLFLADWKLPQTRQAFMTRPFQLLFVLTYFLVYFLLYTWYSWISDGNRFILALFLPLMYAVALALNAMDTPSPRKLRGRTVSWLALLNLLVLLLIVGDIYFILTDRIQTMFGGV